MAFFRKKHDKKSDLTLPPVTPSYSPPPVAAPVPEAPPAGTPERRAEPNEPWSLAAGALAALRCSLGADATVSGRLSFTKPTRLDGTLRGEVRATDLLVIGETGLVDGSVHAAHLVILGRVNGDVHEAEKVEITAGGTLNGNVSAQYLIVQEGGFIEGDCRIVPPARPVVVEEPPAPEPVPSFLSQPVAQAVPVAESGGDASSPPEGPGEAEQVAAEAEAVPPEDETSRS